MQRRPAWSSVTQCQASFRSSSKACGSCPARQNFFPQPSVSESQRICEARCVAFRYLYLRAYHAEHGSRQILPGIAATDDRLEACAFTISLAPLRSPTSAVVTRRACGSPSTSTPTWSFMPDIFFPPGIFYIIFPYGGSSPDAN